MKIKILSDNAKSVAKCIGKYIFAEVKECQEKQNIEWLSNFTKFYKDLLQKDMTGEYIIVDVEHFIKTDLADMVSRHIFEDLSQIENEQLLFEMIGIYNQLTEDKEDKEDEKDTNNDIGENYDTEQKYNKVIKQKEINSENNFIIKETEKEQLEADDVFEWNNENEETEFV